MLRIVACSVAGKDLRSAGEYAFTSDLSRFLKEFLESYGMAMVSTLVSSNLFFGSTVALLSMVSSE